VAALKTGTSKGERFQPAKPGNFDGVRDRKVVDVWLTEMEDYIHAAEVGQHSAVELAQSYLKGYAATWWRTVRQDEGKNHGYTWEFFKDRCRNPSFGLATNAKGIARLRANRKEARESRQRHCKNAGQEEARELRQEEARESHHILPGV
jgi:hypothetical protein